VSHTYTGDPAVSNVAWVRWKIGDTGPSYSGYGWVFTDEETARAIADAGGNMLMACASLLVTWAIRLASQPDFQIGRFGESSNADAAAALNTKAKELQAAANAQMAGAFAGGISVSDKAGREANTDRTPSDFRRTQFDNPEGW